MTITLPHWTTANERLFGNKIHPKNYGMHFVDNLRNDGWIIENNGDMYQPLFGLTAKTIDGKERTVVEGDVLLAKHKIFGDIIATIAWNKNAHGFNARYMGKVVDEFVWVQLWDFIKHDPTVLCHCTEIVAAGGKLNCWECGGVGKVFWDHNDQETGDNLGKAEDTCPTCHGVGQHNVIWKG